MKKVLLVEDDEITGNMLRHKLSRDQYEVEMAVNGLDAVKILDTFVPDVIVTDLMLPFVSGLELINHVRQVKQSEVPVIVLSFSGDEAMILKAFDMGASDFMTKPFSPNELSVRIKKLLAKK